MEMFHLELRQNGDQYIRINSQNLQVVDGVTTVSTAVNRKFIVAPTVLWKFYEAKITPHTFTLGISPRKNVRSKTPNVSIFHPS